MIKSLLSTIFNALYIKLQLYENNLQKYLLNNIGPFISSIVSIVYLLLFVIIIK